MQLGRLGHVVRNGGRDPSGRVTPAREDEVEPHGRGDLAGQLVVVGRQCVGDRDVGVDGTPPQGCPSLQASPDPGEPAGGP